MSIESTPITTLRLNLADVVQHFDGGKYEGGDRDKAALFCGVFLLITLQFSAREVG
ncbi:MAG: hypothetical protein F6K30_10285 [Cyanothece sp. SIO2G6]|nr:hypothetical protein [Cyanothece sp. SIO2G6]